jgi:hypothetical protein
MSLNTAGSGLRSHSTDKQTQNFLSKLDNKAMQMTSSQDDSGMMHRQGKQAPAQVKKNQRPLTNNVFLPRTGIEQPFMRDRPRFKETHKEFEPTNQVNV